MQTKAAKILMYSTKTAFSNNKFSALQYFMSSYLVCDKGYRKHELINLDKSSGTQ